MFDVFGLPETAVSSRRGTLVVASDARRDVFVKLGARKPRGMSVHTATARLGIPDLGVYILVPEQDTGIVHHFGKRDHARMLVKRFF